MKRALFIIIFISFCLFSGGQIKAPLQQSWFQTGQQADVVLSPYSGSGGSSALHHPSHVFTDPSGRVYVADTRNP